MLFYFLSIKTNITILIFFKSDFKLSLNGPVLKLKTIKHENSILLMPAVVHILTVHPRPILEIWSSESSIMGQRWNLAEVEPTGKFSRHTLEILGSHLFSFCFLLILWFPAARWVCLFHHTHQCDVLLHHRLKINRKVNFQNWWVEGNFIYLEFSYLGFLL